MSGRYARREYRRRPPYICKKPPIPLPPDEPIAPTELTIYLCEPERNDDLFEELTQITIYAKRPRNALIWTGIFRYSDERDFTVIIDGTENAANKLTVRLTLAGYLYDSFEAPLEEPDYIHRTPPERVARGDTTAGFPILAAVYF